MDPYENKTNTLEFEKTSSNEIFRCFQNHKSYLHWIPTIKTQKYTFLKRYLKQTIASYKQEKVP